MTKAGNVYGAKHFYTLAKLW